MSDTPKVVLVTGASRGIGRAVVKELARRGAQVIFTYLSNENLAKQLEEEIASTCNLPAWALRADSRVMEEARNIVQTVIERYGTIDVLVNNAGIKKDSPLLLMKEEEWNDVLGTNLNSVFNYSKCCAFHMFKKKSGRIVNISSISGLYGLPGQTNYSTSKAGIVGFTRALAKETAGHGIAVNTIAPGGVATEMVDSMTEKARAELLASIPAKRFCAPEEVANVAAYLSLDSPNYLTGSTIVLDGGMGISG